MTNSLSGSRILLSAAVAALFVASPVTLKVDASGAAFFASAAAFAQVGPDLIDSPPGGSGPIEQPDCGPECGPSGGPVEPPDCGPECTPVDGPIDPPPCEVNCGTLDGPIDPAIEDCERSKDGCTPETVVLPVLVPAVLPVSVPSGSDDDVVPPVVKKVVTTKEDAMTLANSLECQVACKAVVEGNGDVTVTLNTVGPEGAEAKTTVTLSGTEVDLTVRSITLSSDFKVLHDFGDRSEAEAQFTGVVRAIPQQIIVNGMVGPTLAAQALDIMDYSVEDASQLGTVKSFLESNFESDSSSNS